MERISGISLSELALQSNGSEARMTLLRPPCSDAVVLALGQLMAEAQAFKPNQELPPGTPDMYLQAWEEIAQEFGMDLFAKGLWRALRKSPFFPAPNEVEEACVSIITAEREARRVAREASEREQRERDSRAWQQQHREAYPEQYDASGVRVNFGKVRA